MGESHYPRVLGEGVIMSIKRSDVFSGIENAKNPDEVFNWINKASSEGSAPEFDQDVFFRVRSYGLERLSDLTADNPDIARELLLGSALDMCIADVKTGVERHYYSEYRNILIKWIEGFPSQIMQSLRNAFLEEIVLRLKKKPNADLIWIVSVLGYRDDRVCAVLNDFALDEAGDQSVRDAALSTLCSLGGLSEDKRESFRILAEKRLAEGWTIPLFNALCWICSSKSINFLISQLVSPSVERQGYSHVLSLSALSEIAKSHSEEVAENIWEGILAATNENDCGKNRLKISDVVFNSGLLKGIDLEAVPRKLLGLLASDGENRPNDHFRYIIYKRLCELTGSNQLQEFAGQPDQAVLGTIRNDCIRNTENTSSNTDLNSWIKESAWDVALRLGVSAALNWTEGVFGEVNPYTRGHILKLLACFSFKRLPDEIEPWLRERVDKDGGGDNPQIFYIDPAIRLAGHSSDPRALEWLLDLGLTYRGQVPLSAANALSTYCVERIRNSEDQIAEARTVISQLLSGFNTDWEGKTDGARPRRMLAAAALEAVSAEFKLDDNEIREVIQRFNELDFAEDVFALCPLARIVAAKSSDENTLNRLKRLAIHDNSWVAAYGVSALEKADKIDDDQLLKKNGLIHVKGNFTVADESNVSELGAYLLGHDYLKNRKSVLLIAAVITNGEWRAVSQLLRVLSNIKADSQPLEDAIFNALISRILDRMSTSYAETNLFKFLAQLAPEKLLQTEWSNYWTGWSTESRIALIGATHLAAKCDLNKQLPNVLAILGGLERDPVEEVRQATRQAWVTLYPKSLNALIEGRSDLKQSSEDDLRLAAEALWAVSDDEILRKVTATLMDAPERRVRETCRESIRARHELSVAWSQFEAALNFDADTASMLKAWKHGAALIEIGHRDHLESLRRHHARRDLRPNQRFWIKMLVEKLEKKIEERQRKKTPDWSPPGAQTIRQPGRVIISDIEREAVLVIRKWESEGLGDALRWEGDGWVSGYLKSFPLFGELEIELNDGSGGKAMISGSSIDSGIEGFSFSFSGMQWRNAGGHEKIVPHL